MGNESKILRHFDEYRRLIKNTWEEYLLLNFSLTRLKEIHKKKSISTDFKRELLLENARLDYKDKDIHLFIKSIIDHKLGFKTLIEAVSLTENYLQILTALVYRDFPLRLTNSNPDSPQSELKLTNLIITSASRDDIIEALIEEKIRGIFYGKPTDFFEKDKAKIGLNDFIKINYPKSIIQYGEITARRNLVVHNSGKVDSKYLREVAGTSYTKGQKIQIDKPYIKNSIIILRGISAVTTQLVLQNIYNKNVSKVRVARIANTLKIYAE
jgi:hypothetical protein